LLPLVPVATGYQERTVRHIEAEDAVKSVIFHCHVAAFLQDTPSRIGEKSIAICVVYIQCQQSLPNPCAIPCFVVQSLLSV
jgi:hypothetical protein